MPTFLVLYDAGPEEFLIDGDDHPHSDAQKLANNAHRYIHEHLGNQVSGTAVVTNPNLHERLESAWKNETLDVYAVVVHPPDTTSDVVNVYADREKAKTEADDLRSEDQRIEVAVKQYEVEAVRGGSMTRDAKVTEF